MIFPKKIEFLRTQRGWSQRAFVTELVSAGIEVSQRAVSGWESGSLPRPEIAKKLADYFGLTVDQLLNDSKELPQRTWERLRSVVEEAAIPWPNDKKAQDIAGNAALDAHSPLHAQNLKTVRQLRAWAKECSDLADQIENLSTSKTHSNKKPI